MDATGIGNTARQCLSLGGGSDEPKAVAQPLDSGARDEDAALERVGGLATRAAGGRCQNAFGRERSILARVNEEKP